MGSGFQQGTRGIADDEDRFLLSARPQVVEVLRSLQRKPEIVAAYFESGRRFLITAVLDVDVESERLFLDVSPDRVLNERALLAGRLMCVTRQDNIDVRFVCDGIVWGEHREKPAFLAPIPDKVYRRQRREFFRVQAPVGRPFHCRLPVRDDENTSGETVQCRIVDLSLGGVGVVLEPGVEFPLEVGEVLPGCRLLLGELGEITVVLQVRGVSRHVFRGGKEGRRIGLAFESIAPPDGMRLQRFINQLQLAARNARPG
ncbi:MAG: flagellar brake protein [Ectothiorhodospiraceae bacterium]|nr:flagellar brake protein [Ectothiorhodospiraceae bacterium]